MAVFAPMPSASDATTTPVMTGVAISERIARRRPCMACPERSSTLPEGKHAVEVSAEDLFAHLDVRTDLVERARLLLVHVLNPSPREERRIAAEEQPIGAGDRDRLAEHGGEREGGVIADRK